MSLWIISGVALDKTLDKIITVQDTVSEIMDMVENKNLNYMNHKIQEWISSLDELKYPKPMNYTI